MYNTTCSSTWAYRRGKNGRCQALGLPWQYPVSLMMHWRKGGHGGVCIAAIIDGLLPPNPAHVLSGGRGVEALILAILDGHHALYKVGSRLEERGMLPLLQSGLDRTALNDYRLGQILDALFAANLNQVFGAVALKALEVYAIPTPWLHQDTTTIPLSGAYEEEARGGTQGPPRPRAFCRRVRPTGLTKMGTRISSR